MRRNPQDTILQILPEPLHRFFFFDGERIEHLVKPTAKGEIATAVKNLLGLEIIERSITHLKKARRPLESELQSPGSPKTAQIQSEIDAARDELDDKTIERQKLEENGDAIQDELEVVDEQLRTSAITSNLQQTRERLEAQRKGNIDTIFDERKHIQNVINERGFLAFTSPMAESLPRDMRNNVKQNNFHLL